MLIDYRCPKCDRPIDGGQQEVRIAEQMDQARKISSVCCYCKTKVKPIMEDTDLGEEVHFSIDKPFQTRGKKIEAGCTVSCSLFPKWTHGVGVVEEVDGDQAKVELARGKFKTVNLSDLRLILTVKDKATNPRTGLPRWVG